MKKLIILLVAASIICIESIPYEHSCGENAEYHGCASACSIATCTNPNPGRSPHRACIQWKNCASSCQPTCSTNPKTDQLFRQCFRLCIPRCVCKEGYVRNLVYNCVLPKDCIARQLSQD
ncbi:hypothetical protein pipiens_017807 [Culex pipiens pipiens]|uniref:TIL domain-containing protein n=1 Tax=Culex pipiens pipiens TaxID=38569 RepID=A0ABD1CEU7_CULPP